MTDIKNVNSTVSSMEIELVPMSTGTDSVTEQVSVAAYEDIISPASLALLRSLSARRDTFQNPRDALVAVAGVLSQVQSDIANAETNQAKLNSNISNALTENAQDSLKKIIEECQKFLAEVAEQERQQKEQEERSGILGIIFGVVDIIVGVITLNPAIILAGALQITIGSLQVTHNMEAARDFIAKGFEAFGMSSDDAKLASDFLIMGVVMLAQFAGNMGILGFVEALVMGINSSPFLMHDLAKHIVDKYYSNLSEQEKAEKMADIEKAMGYFVMALAILCAAARIGPMLKSLPQATRSLINTLKQMSQSLAQTVRNFLRSAEEAAEAAHVVTNNKTMWEKLKDIGSNLKSEAIKNPQLVATLVTTISGVAVNAENAESSLDIAASKREQAKIKRMWSLIEAELLITQAAMRTSDEIGKQQVENFNAKLDSHKRMTGELLNAITEEGSSYVNAMQA